MNGDTSHLKTRAMARIETVEKVDITYWKVHIAPNSLILLIGFLLRKITGHMCKILIYRLKFDTRYLPIEGQ
ncbi:hypothetical protein L2E82_27610 [Cichorium intybus]|uniref:Uncharacterized protein n=1 Tax=Cichorium intybus TaxID=13427 RepID=A0ACB9CTI2_CICIN|nr:hypothetical protein L2E82_27610 [Cichorium intybus]